MNKHGPERLDLFYFQNDAHMHQILLEEHNKEILPKDQQTSESGSLPKILGHVSSGRGIGELHPSQNNNAQEATSRATAPTTGEPRMNRDATTQEMHKNNTWRQSECGHPGVASFTKQQCTGGDKPGNCSNDWRTQNE